MRTLFVSLAIASLLATSGSFPVSSNNGTSLQLPSIITAQPAGINKQENEQEQKERRRRTFQKGRAVLEQKGVPFNAEDLLDADWRVKLIPNFALIPEMQQKRRMGRRLKGAQLADVLYLPERVELTGDTVILANKLLFEGTDVVIKGNYNFYLYVSGVTGVLGTTLEVAMERQRRERGMLFTNVGFRNTSSLNAISLDPVPGGSITVDTSGQGWEEWLAKQKKVARTGPADSSLFRKVSFQDPNDTHGADYASQPPQAAGGPPAAAASPDPAPGTTNGNCTGGGVDGGIANGGYPGGNGNIGETGTTGGTAANGTSQDHNLGSVTVGVFNFDAHGGKGGKGGQGGDGSPGATGGKAGPGGNGANCSCANGGAGSGSNGGPGGFGGQGGQGGRGGKGGTGGSGGDITITVMNNFVGTINYDVSKGAAGLPGDPGARAFRALAVKAGTLVINPAGPYFAMVRQPTELTAVKAVTWAMEIRENPGKPER